MSDSNLFVQAAPSHRRYAYFARMTRMAMRGRDQSMATRALSLSH
jgi:hypothetical protein